MNRSGEAPFAEALAVAFAAAIVSVGSFVHFFRTGEILLYGDAVAHLNIARRVLDSLTPGPFQLGSVWLPLPHLLMLPFVASDRLWKSGVAGSLPSMFAYVAGSVAVYCLVRLYAAAAWAALGTFLFMANPNLIYMQATAMTEPLYVALVLWIIYFLARAAVLRHDRPAECAYALGRCAMVLALALLTRYDAWMLAAAIVPSVAWMVRAGPNNPAIISMLQRAVLLIALAPSLWLVYNASIFGDPLYFARGPYSAKAIEQKTRRPGDPGHPGEHSLKVAIQYFLKAAKLNVAAGSAGNWFVVIALLGTAASLIFLRNSWPLLLLWMAVPFYAWSIAYGSVPIFVPVWWPFSWYNVRYGLELLPVFAVFVPLAGCLLPERRSVTYSVAVLAALVAGLVDYAEWKHVPITLQEARVNSLTRIAYENELAGILARLPGNAKLLMYTSAHVGALQTAGVPLRHVINEANDVLWQGALANPAGTADYVVAGAGDPVERSVREHGANLTALAIVDSSGQPRTVVYRSLLR